MLPLQTPTVEKSAMKKVIDLLIQKLFAFDEWRVGLIPSDQLSSIIQSQQCDESTVIWLDIDGCHYQADPFLFEVDSELVLAYESMSQWHRIGKVKCANLQGEPLPYFDTLSSREGHQSFPYVFTYQGELYCLPETADTGKLKLFKYDSHSKQFEFFRTLLSDVSVVDSFIYPKDGILYLFCTHKVDGNFVQKLHVSRCFGQDFQEHPSSPIASGKSHGRNAGGLVEHAGKLYRISQECGRFYGEGLNFHHIQTMNRDEYIESKAFNLTFSNTSKYGYHTFGVYRDWIVIDGKERRYSLLAPFMKIKAKLSKWRMRVSSSPKRLDTSAEAHNYLEHEHRE
ncbi:hypothetical protein GCM10026988_17320 [Vibrio panuliri]|uniref:Glucosamine inositolphosphorylceramide transferase 1 N-terminal domain-containing protein n=2 Tax=Vibrio panuliri TaxID=1381081 RepID=A0ABX3FA87_9VIBR|nr:hypothetical protein BIY20_15695 [Vibrio panuliri]